MSNGPVAGNGIAITIPAGKVVFWTALVQAAFNQFIQVKDGSGNVVFTVQGASSQGGTPTQIGQGFFQASDPNGAYTVWIGVNGGQWWQSVLWDEKPISVGGTAYFDQFTFISEDSTDNDFNDTCLQMRWFQFLG